jgi:hypothetical protein
MKLFKFYPNVFCRMYVVGNSKEEILSRKDEIFDHYVKTNCLYIDFNDPDDLYFLDEKKEEFEEGIQKLEELPSGIAIDSHY